MPKKAIRLLPDENHQLKQLYLAKRIPIDQYAQRPNALANLVDEWNNLTGRSDSIDEVRHYMITRRKAGSWVKFNGTHERKRCPGEDVFDPSEWTALESIYLELNKGRDNYAIDSELRNLFAEKFLEKTGRYISGDLLYAAAMARQKSGNWVHVDIPPKKNQGFRDIEDVA